MVNSTIGEKVEPQSVNSLSVVLLNTAGCRFYLIQIILYNTLSVYSNLMQIIVI